MLQSEAEELNRIIDQLEQNIQGLRNTCGYQKMLIDDVIKVMEADVNRLKNDTLVSMAESVHNSIAAKNIERYIRMLKNET